MNHFVERFLEISIILGSFKRVEFVSLDCDLNIGFNNAQIQNYTITKLQETASSQMSLDSNLNIGFTAANGEKFW